MNEVFVHTHILKRTRNSHRRTPTQTIHLLIEPCSVIDIEHVALQGSSVTRHLNQTKVRVYQSVCASTYAYIYVCVLAYNKFS